MENTNKKIDIAFEKKFLDDFMIMLKLYEPYLHNKINQTGAISSVIGKALGVTEPQYYLAGYYANVGLLAVGNFVNKGEHISDDEFAVVKRHPVLAAEYLERKGLALCADYEYHHHEKPDGSGYFKESNYPKEAAYINIADVFQGCVTPKPYRPPLTIREAIKTTLDDYRTYIMIDQNEVAEIEKVLRAFYETL
ncbi:MAG: hypothetical protein KN64_00685 [Sulfurovum sp. AS07-7]|nr:MAG: hypothetical protein KN64_00685 [Sulfurovum sp. AS07-7]